MQEELTEWNHGCTLHLTFINSIEEVIWHTTHSTSVDIQPVQSTAGPICQRISHCFIAACSVIIRSAHATKDGDWAATGTSTLIDNDRVI